MTTVTLSGARSDNNKTTGLAERIFFWLIALVCVATGIISASLGYWLGTQSSVIAPSTVGTTPPPTSKPVAADEDEDDSDDSDDGGANLADVKADTFEECKLVCDHLVVPDEATNRVISQVLIVRTDLGMTKGKIAAQCSYVQIFAPAKCSILTSCWPRHATLACYKALSKSNPSVSCNLIPKSLSLTS